MSAVQASNSFVEEVEVAGHIIDSLILPKILDLITESGGRFRRGATTPGFTLKRRPRSATSQQTTTLEPAAALI